MKKAGVPQFDYNTFKKAYDSNTQLKDLTDFDPEGVTIKDPNKTELEPKNSTRGADDVSKMAKRAVDFDDL
jgi:hypothetical protein